MRALRSRRVVTPSGVRPATLIVDRETIARIDSYDLDLEGADAIDAGNDVVMPGVVDAHVHVNEPGRADWEGFEHATRGAAAGGVTTIVDMPLNSIPATTDHPAFQRKREAARGRLAIDVGFWGGVVPGNAHALESLWAAGVLGFKCFLVPSGVPEFHHVTEDDLEQALPVLARLDAPLLVHAELPEYLAPVVGAQRSYDTYLASRPIEAETAAIDLMIRLAEHHCARVHIVHVSSAEGAQRIHDAKRRGVRISGETCPHYLTFASDEIADGTTAFKCAPPIRDRSARAALWHALDRGALDFVASDHSPAPPSMKAIDTGDFMSAWGGIASLQLLLPAVWTGARANGQSVDCIASWLAERPAALAGLSARKGSFAPGADADIVVWDPDDSFVVDPGRLFHRHPLTPYAGRQLHGVVHQTWLRGEVVYDGRRHLRTDAGHLIVR
jgi:allantoinase